MWEKIKSIIYFKYSAPNSNFYISKIIHDLNWHLLFDSEAQMLFILQNHKIEIRSSGDDFVTLLAEIEIPRPGNSRIYGGSIKGKNDYDHAYHKIVISPNSYRVNDVLLVPEERIIVVGTSLHDPFNVYGLDGVFICSFKIDVELFGEAIKATQTISDHVVDMIFLQCNNHPKVTNADDPSELNEDIDKETSQRCFELWVITFSGTMFSIEITLPAISFEPKFAFDFGCPVFATSYDTEREILLLGGFPRTGTKPPTVLTPVKSSKGLISQRGVTMWRRLNQEPHLREVDILDHRPTASQKHEHVTDKQLTKRSPAFESSWTRYLASYLYDARRAQAIRPVTRLTPSPGHARLASLEGVADDVTVWKVPSLRIERTLGPAAGLKGTNEDVSPAVSDICWWDNDTVAMLWEDGRIVVEPLTSDKEGGCLRLKSHGSAITRLSDGRLVVIDCHREWKKMAHSPSNLSHGLCDGSLVRSFDLRLGKWLAIAIRVNANVLCQVMKLLPAPYYRDFVSSWSVKDDRSEKSLLTIHNMYLVEATTPSQLFDKKIASESYSEALALANEYGLDADLVYQKQWKLSPKTVPDIAKYLDKILDRPWVINQALECSPPTLADAEAILKYGSKELERDDQLPFAKESKEWVALDEKFRKYISRLGCYKDILSLPDARATSYEPHFYRKVLTANAYELALHFCRVGRPRVLGVLYGIVGPPLLQHWLPLLLNLPECLDPGDYLHLLPKCHYDTDGNVILTMNPPTQHKHQGDIVRMASLPNDDDPSVIYGSDDSADVSEFRGYPIEVNTLQKFLEARALDIEKRTHLVGYATRVLEYGTENCLKGLLPLLLKFRILNTLVYDCQIDCDEILASTQIPYSNLSLKFVSESTHSSLLELSMGQISSQKNCLELSQKSRTKFRKNFMALLELLDFDKFYRRSEIAGAETYGPAYKVELLNGYIHTLALRHDLPAIEMLTEELIKEGGILLEEHVLNTTPANREMLIFDRHLPDDTTAQRSLFYMLAQNLLTCLALCCNHGNAKIAESALSGLENYVSTGARVKADLPAVVTTRGDQTVPRDLLVKSSLLYKHYPDPEQISSLRTDIKSIRDHVRSMAILHKYGLEVTVSKLEDVATKPKELMEMIFKVAHKARSFPLAKSLNHWQIIYNDLIDLYNLSFGKTMPQETTPIYTDSSNQNPNNTSRQHLPDTLKGLFKYLLQTGDETLIRLSSSLVSSSFRDRSKWDAGIDFSVRESVKVASQVERGIGGGGKSMMEELDGMLSSGGPQRDTDGDTSSAVGSCRFEEPIKTDIKKILLDVVGEYVNSAVDTRDPQLHWARLCLQLFPHLLPYQGKIRDSSADKGIGRNDEDGVDSALSVELRFLEALTVINELRSDCVPLQIRLAAQKDLIGMIDTYLIKPSPTNYLRSVQLEKVCSLLSRDQYPRWRLFEVMASRALQLSDTLRAIKYALKLVASRPPYHGAIETGNDDAWSTCLKIVEAVSPDKMNRDSHATEACDDLLAFAIATCPTADIEKVLEARTQFMSDPIGDSHEMVDRIKGTNLINADGEPIPDTDEKPRSITRGTLSTLTELVHGTYFDAIALESQPPTSGNSCRYVTDLSTFGSEFGDHFGRLPSDTLFRQLVHALCQLGIRKDASPLEKCTVLRELLSLYVSRSYVYGKATVSNSVQADGPVLYLNLLVMLLLRLHSPTEKELDLDIGATLLTACHDFDPSSKMTLQNLFIEVLTYAIAINLSLKCYQPCKSPLDQITTALAFAKIWQSSAFDLKLPEESRKRLTTLFESLSSVIDRMTAYRNVMAITSMKKGIDVNQFVSSQEYRSDTLSGLALTADGTVFQKALKIAQHYGVDQTEIYLNHLEYLLTDTESNLMDNWDRIRLEVLPSLAKILPETTTTKSHLHTPLGMIERLSVNVLPLLRGQDYDRLIKTFSTMELLSLLPICQSSGESSVIKASVDRHLTNLRTIKTLAPALNYSLHFLSTNFASSDPTRDNATLDRLMIPNLQNALTDKGTVEAMATLLRTRDENSGNKYPFSGNLETTAGEKALYILEGPVSLTPSILYMAWAQKLFWEQVREQIDKMNSTEKKSRDGHPLRLNPERAVLCLRPCFPYLPILEPRDLERFVENGVLFGPESRDLLDVEARVACCETLEAFVSGFGTTPDDSTYGNIVEKIRRLRDHLKSFDANILLCLKTSMDKGIPKYELDYDLSRGQPDQLRDILADMIVNGVEEDLIMAFYDFVNEQLSTVPNEGGSEEGLTFRTIFGTIIDDIVTSLALNKTYVRKYRVAWDTVLDNLIRFTIDNTESIVSDGLDPLNWCIERRLLQNQGVDIPHKFKVLAILRRRMEDSGIENGTYAFYTSIIRLEQVLGGPLPRVQSEFDVSDPINPRLTIEFDGEGEACIISKHTLTDRTLRDILLRTLIEHVTRTSVLETLGSQAFEKYFSLCELIHEWQRIYQSKDLAVDDDITKGYIIRLSELCVDVIHIIPDLKVTTSAPYQHSLIGRQGRLVELFGSLYKSSLLTTQDMLSIMDHCTTKSPLGEQTPYSDLVERARSTLAIWCGLALESDALNSLALEMVESGFQEHTGGDGKSPHASSDNKCKPCSSLINHRMARIIVDRKLVPAFARVCSLPDFEVIVDYLSSLTSVSEKTAGSKSDGHSVIQSIVDQLRAAGLEAKANYVRNSLAIVPDTEDTSSHFSSFNLNSSTLYASGMAQTEKARSLAKSASNTLFSLANRSTQLFSERMGTGSTKKEDKNL